MILKKIKNYIYSFFREFLVFHHSSLEFRAKLLASMISIKESMDECEKETLESIASEIYKDDENRAEILVNTTLEYVKKVHEMNDLYVDDLILDIDKSLKRYPKFYKKIDIEKLNRFLKCKASTDEKLLRLRILEYFKRELEYKGLLNNENNK
jgi:hypothetical protein